jgi:hypothetical protein
LAWVTCPPSCTLTLRPVPCIPGFKHFTDLLSDTIINLFDLVHNLSIDSIWYGRFNAICPALF